MNRYDIKVYSKSWVYQSTINPNIVMNDISFTEAVNSWQGQMRLNLALDFWDRTFNWGEVIKVILYNEKYKQGKQIYIWYVSQISRIYDVNKWYISLSCLWIGSLLSQILYRWSHSWTATEILTDIIGVFNTNYSWDLITIGTIDPYEWNLSYDFENNTTCLKAITTVSDTANYYRYIDWEWVFTFREKLTQTNHIVANQKSVENMNLNYNIESLVNKFYVSRKDWTIKTYEDSDSQLTYGIKEKYEQNTDIYNEATQDEYGNNYIAQYSNPKNASSMIINSEYDIESIIPWDTITVVNTDYQIKDLLIEKISRTPDKVNLTLEENESLWSIISS